MVFSDIPFLYYFLPSVLLGYFLVPRGWRNAAVLLSSLIFYAWGEPRYVVLIVFSILQGYGFGIAIERSDGKKRKAFLTASVLISLGLLGFFKYADFFAQNLRALTGLPIAVLRIVLPVGISFYTFQILSYVVDVYRGSAPAQKNPVDLAAYIAMFPQLIAGPIVRYTDIAVQLRTRSHSIEKCARGIRRFVIGLGKKVLLANPLGALCAAFRVSGDRSVLYFWLYAAAYMLQIYFDFSGYSDMAIGLGKVFGFDFPENFRYPYIARSVTEFWRRWHISLGAWFRDYVYIPLGGNRVPKGRWLFNILVVWLCTGFWHGAAWSFIVWGLYFGILLIAEKLWLGGLLSRSRVLSHAFVLLAVMLSFVIFDSPSLSEAGRVIGAMFGGGGYPRISAEAVYYLKSNALLLVIAAVGATPLPASLCAAAEKTGLAKGLRNTAEPIFLILILLVCTGYIVDGSFNPFLYFRF